MNSLIKSVLLVCSFSRYAKYKELKSQSKIDNSQTTLLSTTYEIKLTDTYSSSHPRQKTITLALIADLIIECSLPLSLVEHPSVRYYMSIVEPKYDKISRRTVTSKLTEMASITVQKIKEEMSKVEGVSVTLIFGATGR